MYSDAVCVYIRETHKHLHAFYLVCHFCLSALPVNCLLKLCSTVLSTSVILYIYEVATLSHIHLPSSEITHECVLDHLRMRTSIYVYDCRILLCRVEVVRLDHTEVVVVFSICTLDCSEADFCVGILQGRVFCNEYVFDDFSVRRAEISHARNAKAAPDVSILSKVRTHRNRMPSRLCCKSFWFAELDNFRSFDSSVLRNFDADSK